VSGLSYCSADGVRGIYGEEVELTPGAMSILDQLPVISGGRQDAACLTILIKTFGLRTGRRSLSVPSRTLDFARASGWLFRRYGLFWRSGRLFRTALAARIIFSQRLLGPDGASASRHVYGPVGGPNRRRLFVAEAPSLLMDGEAGSSPSSARAYSKSRRRAGRAKPELAEIPAGAVG